MYSCPALEKTRRRKPAVSSFGRERFVGRTKLADARKHDDESDKAKLSWGVNAVAINGQSRISAQRRVDMFAKG